MKKSCKENWGTIPYSSEHLWKAGLHGEPCGNCLRCRKPVCDWNEELLRKVKEEIKSEESKEIK